MVGPVGILRNHRRHGAALNIRLATTRKEVPRAVATLEEAGGASDGDAVEAGGGWRSAAALEVSRGRELGRELVGRGLGFCGGELKGEFDGGGGLGQEGEELAAGLDLVGEEVGVGYEEGGEDGQDDEDDFVGVVDVAAGLVGLFSRSGGVLDGGHFGSRRGSNGGKEVGMFVRSRGEGGCPGRLMERIWWVWVSKYLGLGRWVEHVDISRREQEAHQNITWITRVLGNNSTVIFVEQRRFTGSSRLWARDQRLRFLVRRVKETSHHDFSGFLRQREGGWAMRLDDFLILDLLLFYGLRFEVVVLVRI